MSSVLKGNFQPQKKVEAVKPQTTDGQDLESLFENEAIKRLGGSIAFVSKKKIAWDLKD